MLIAAGVDVVTVSRRLGHSKPDVTLRVYSHLFAADDSAAAAAIDRALNIMPASPGLYCRVPLCQENRAFLAAHLLAFIPPCTA